MYYPEIIAPPETTIDNRPQDTEGDDTPPTQKNFIDQESLFFFCCPSNCTVAQFWLGISSSTVRRPRCRARD